MLLGAWLQEGQHVDLIGAYRPDMREADDQALQRARVFVDSFDTTLDHIGELKIPLASGALSRADVQAIPKIEGNKGKSVVEVSQFGGRYGKTSDNTTSGEGDIENGDGISHRKENGLKLEFNWERQPNNTYKVFANLV